MPPKANKTLQEIVAEGDVGASLEAIRDRLAAELATAGPREAAPLAARLVEVIGRIASLPAKEKSGVDELKDRRSRRVSAVPKRPGSGVKRGAGSG